MNDPRLRQLLDHPPRDAEPTARPAFTAAVMARVPSSAPSTARDHRLSEALTGTSGAWWLAAAVAAAGTFLLPLDPVSAVGDWSRLIEADLVIELCAASALVAAALSAVSGSRRMRS